ncbi:hypothetical protein CEXT_453211 [Caerostris extrusa]|uniref:Uncharacterized protein n=1 Tax=Caerostris extrusa TaxID=172846 RepID=A0AAV4SMV2_CAEEX|nr:hypothetical protein CEXT_453211 [Caerostris extrusa]
MWNWAVNVSASKPELELFPINSRDDPPEATTERTFKCRVIKYFGFLPFVHSTTLKEVSKRNLQLEFYFWIRNGYPSRNADDFNPASNICLVHPIFWK